MILAVLGWGNWDFKYSQTMTSVPRIRLIANLEKRAKSGDQILVYKEQK